MKYKIIILAILMSCLMSSACADPNIMDIPDWNPETGIYTSYWFDYTNGDFMPYGFLQSLTSVWTNELGYWFFLIIWGIYIWGIWNRERAIELTLVVMLLTGTMWGALLPPESFSYLYLFIAMGVASILWKVFKSGR